MRNFKSVILWATLPVLLGLFYLTSPMNAGDRTGVLNVDGSAYVQPVSVGSLPLPAGASTSASQASQISSLVSIDGKIPSLGQAANSGSLPVVISSNQTAIPVTASNPSVGTNGSAIPASSAQCGGSDGTNLRPIKVSSTGVVSVDGSAVTQPVSGTFWPATQPISGSVSVSNFPASQAVTGTFWQATQPVSGTFFQATQPISAAALPLPSGASTSAKQPALGTAGSASTDVLTVQGITSMTALKTDGSAVTQPVSGTFWQATQPVSGPLTDAQLRATSVPVSGTFWQATQPVSGPLTDTQLRASAVPVSGPLTDTQIRATALPVSGTVTANQGGTWTVQPGNTANTTAWKVDGSAVTQPVSGTLTANVGTVPTLTKGTQGASGYSIQELKDAGRNQTNYFMALPIVSTATDALMSLTGYKGGAAVVATTTPAVVTAGKTYRLTSITLTYVTIVTTPGGVKFTLRANTGGVVAITSPAVMSWFVGEPSGAAPVAGKYNTISIPLADGVEFAAGTGIGISMVGANTVGAAAVVGFGHASLNGFEY